MSTKLKSFLLLLNIEIADSLIQDGLMPSDQMCIDNIKDAIISKILGYAYPHEYNVNISIESQPHKDVINKIINAD